MLTYLHVKNLAVVEDIEVEFDDNLNILTGETGVGKSVIMGSINIALGGKMSPDMVRNGETFALVEMIFEPSGEEWELLKEYEVFPEEDRLVISRKYAGGRSTCRVNGETVTLAMLKNISAILIDIHGQHEHQSLLYPEKHLAIIDRYAADEVTPVKEKVSSLYSEYKRLSKELSSMKLSDDERQRELDFLEYEINEIENMNLNPGEEESLEEEYRRLSNSEKIIEIMGNVYELVGNNDRGASAVVSEALMNINEAAELDHDIDNYRMTLVDVDSILSDLSRELSSYVNDYTFDREKFNEIDMRLDSLRRLYSKYGGTYELTMEHYDEICKKRDTYRDYEETLRTLKASYDKNEQELLKESNKLTDIRKKAAESLKVLIGNALCDLNFPANCFDIEFKAADSYGANGMDDIGFLIAANPGEPFRPLAKVASGGELSRIMLAIKSVLADSDEIHTLIFDEIDTGISGRTAQMVSEKLAVISASHQVICITHLPQIAAMADNHFVIEKIIDSGRTRTQIRLLDDSEIVEELARITGGTRITESVLGNAKEMKLLANEWKESL